MNTYKPVRSKYPNAPQSTKGTKGQYGVWPPEMPYGPGPGAWPKVCVRACVCVCV